MVIEFSSFSAVYDYEKNRQHLMGCEVHSDTVFRLIQQVTTVTENITINK